MKKAAVVNKLVPIAITLALVAVLVPAAAEAKGAKKVRSTFSGFQVVGLIDQGGHVGYKFAGEVYPQGLIFRCATRRTVVLFRDEPNGQPDTRVGSTRTDFLGDFLGSVRLSVDQIPGAYYARVEAKVVHGGRNKRKLRCLAGRSDAIGVAAPQFN